MRESPSLWRGLLIYAIIVDMTYQRIILHDRPAALWNADLVDITGNGFEATSVSALDDYSSLVAGGGSAKVLTNTNYLTLEAPLDRPKPFALELWMKPQNLDPTVETVILGQDGTGIFATSLNLIGRIQFDNDDSYEVTIPFSEWKLAHHVALVFDGRGITLYMDGEGVGVNIDEHNVGRYVKTFTNPGVIYSGLSASASEIVVDSPAVYGNAMHGDSISRHFRWGRAVLRAEQIVALAGGNFIRLSDGNADIYQEDEYATVDDWQRGFFTGTTTLGDRLVAGTEGGVTVEGTWETLIDYSTVENDILNGIKLGWIGAGVTVETSFDGETWTPLSEDEPIVDVTPNTPLDDFLLYIRINFISGLEEAYVDRLRVVAYRTLVLTGDSGVDAQFLPAVLTEEDFEPIQDYDDRGLQYGPLVIEEEADWTEVNLVTNGDASDGNTNFSDATWQSDSPAGADGSFVLPVELQAEEFIEVDLGEQYEMRYWGKGSGVVQAGLVPYDENHNRIYPHHFMYYEETNTVLAQDLVPGDEKVYLEDISGYPDATLRPGENRGLIFWNYRDTDSRSYSMNAYANLWSPGAFDVENNSIDLDAPWAGELIPSGTPVNSYRSSGEEFIYCANGDLTSAWTEFSGIVEGSVETSADTPVYVDSSIDSNFGMDLELNVPVGTQDGDLLIAVVGANWDLDVTPPGGFELVGEASNGGQAATWLYYAKYADGEPASYIWEWPTDQWRFGSILTWRGAEVVNHAINTANGTEVTVPSLKAVGGDVLIAAASTWDDSAKSFDDEGSLTILENQGRGFIIGSQTVDAGQTPEYTMTTQTSGRISAAAILLRGATPSKDNNFWPGTAYVKPIFQSEGNAVSDIQFRPVGEDVQPITAIEAWVRFEDTPAGTIIDNGSQITVAGGTFAASTGTLLVNGQTSFADPVVPLRWYHLLWTFDPVNAETVIGDNSTLSDPSPVQIGQVATYVIAPPADLYSLYQGLPGVVVEDSSGITIDTSSSETLIYDPDWTIVAAD